MAPQADGLEALARSLPRTRWRPSGSASRRCSSSSPIPRERPDDEPDSRRLTKLRTTRAFWLYVAAALAFVPVSVALAITAGPTIGPLGSSAGIRNVMSAASAGGLLILLVGISMMAGEFRHNTATTTFLITPDTRRVLHAKIAVAAIVGLCVAVPASLLAVTVALHWLESRDVDDALALAAAGARRQARTEIA